VGQKVDWSASGHLGDALVLASTVCWATYSVASVPILKMHSPLVVTGYSISIGALLYTLVALPTLVQVEWHAISLVSWVLMVASAVFALAFAYLIWYTSVQKAGSTRKENAIAEQGLIAVAMGPGLVEWLNEDGNTLDLGVEATKVERSRLNRVATMGTIMGGLAAPTSTEDLEALGAIWKVTRSARGIKAGERDRLGAQKFASWSGLASAVEAIIKAKPVEADDKRIAKALKALTSAMEALTDLSTSEAWTSEMLDSLTDGIEGLEAVRTTVETDEEGNAREIA
jgi:hypothetical protein